MPQKRVKSQKPAAKKLPEKERPQQKPVKKLNNKVEVKTIDASGKILGRLATEIAVVIRGKNKPTFRPNLVMGDKVIVFNAAKIKVTGEKMRQKIYYHHTGYIGNLKAESLGEVFRKNPAEVLKRAVYGMLPKNKLRKSWLKNLEIRNGE